MCANGELNQTLQLGTYGVHIIQINLLALVNLNLKFYDSSKKSTRIYSKCLQVPCFYSNS